MNTDMYKDKKNQSSVGGIFIGFVLIAILMIFAIGLSEEDYNSKVSSGEIIEEPAEEYTGDSFNDWFGYVFEIEK